MYTYFDWLLKVLSLEAIVYTRISMHIVGRVYLNKFLQSHNHSCSSLVTKRRCRRNLLLLFNKHKMHHMNDYLLFNFEGDAGTSRKYLLKQSANWSTNKCSSFQKKTYVLKESIKRCNNNS